MLYATGTVANGQSIDGDHWTHTKGVFMLCAPPQPSAGITPYFDGQMNQIENMIGPGDPPPYSIINEQGQGLVLLVGDHASRVIPRALNDLGLEETLLEKHIAYDIGTRKLVHHLSQHLDAPAVLAGYSRLVVDLNRSLEDPSVMPEVSDGTPIPGNLNISAEHRNQRIHSFYTPYRKAI
ncbi:MAG: N-formylglutamate amidohydrolase, partial [Gammaproteobacteria bacterium]|nr:N-formylglutamate amidohydrolase [Gammaproteobacteria bacterium]